MPDEEVLADINAEARTVGTYLYGRRMYEMMTGWETDPSVAAQSPESAQFAVIWQAAEKIVYSSTLTTVSTRRTQLEREFDAAKVEEVKRSSDADLYVDGGQARDAARGRRPPALILCPIIVGVGPAILPTDARLNLRLVSESRYSNGMINLQYDIQH